MALVNTHPDYMNFGELATDTFCSILARRVHRWTRTLLNRGLHGLRQTTADILSGREEYPVAFYEQLLEYIKAEYEGRYWDVLPREMAGFMRTVCGVRSGVKS